MNRNVTVNLDQSRFNYRLAGVVIEDGHVLLHRMERDDFWALPGGRCEVGEPSTMGVAREFREELEAEVQVERLLWTVELFFDWLDVSHHELGLYYKVKFADETLFADKTKVYEGVEGDHKLIYQWFPLKELENTELYPVFLRTSLQELPESPQHVMVDEREIREALNR